MVCAHVCTGLGWFKCPRQKELPVKRMTNQVCLGKGREQVTAELDRGGVQSLYGPLGESRACSYSWGSGTQHLVATTKCHLN